MKTYSEFLARKRHFDVVSNPARDVNDAWLFPFQREIVRWALMRSRCAIFADTGLGKTRMQLAWASRFAHPLIVCPLAVGSQTKAEARAIGLTPPDVINYDRVHQVDPSKHDAIVLDESSIIKHHDSKTLATMMDLFRTIPNKLCATATPAPNDYTELGTHAEFLGVCSRAEMLAEYFTHDGGDTSKWRLKGHARDAFWRWVSTWAVMIRTPADLGYDASAYDIPPVDLRHHVVDTPKTRDGYLFAPDAATLIERRKARSESVLGRVAKAASIVNAEPNEPWVVWCDLNGESEALTESIHGAVEITGSMSSDEKERKLEAFARGDVRVIVSKPSICGWGLNWQHCARMVFVGVTDSYEAYYQAVRRCHRYGQRRNVVVYVVTSDAEGRVVKNIARKVEDHKTMGDELAPISAEAIRGADAPSIRTTYEESTYRTDRGTMMRGDCVEIMRTITDRSIDYSIFSPPFASLYTYSPSERDMGNARDATEFAEHYRFLAEELARVIKPGRLVSVHCMLLPTFKSRDGFIGLDDFRGDLIRIMRDAGFVHHSEVVIWKDPVTAMQRTKALGLLHKQIRKDSSMSRQGIPDYLVTFRAPGENAEPIAHTSDEFPVGLWQRYASPVWMDIDPSDTLQRESAREHEDERHICPLQLEVIRRALKLWTNPGDLVLSPFAGIGSEIVTAIDSGRRGIGIELKRSYYDQACRNMDAAGRQTNLPL